jgi:hypothetical protein
MGSVNEKESRIQAFGKFPRRQRERGPCGELSGLELLFFFLFSSIITCISTLEVQSLYLYNILPPGAYC